MMFRALFFMWLVTFSGCRPNADTKNSNPEIENWKEIAKRVEIIRDDFGVPHIYGKSDADAVFGLLYAQCEDDFNRVEQNYIWAIGRLAEVEGEKALYSDLRAKLYMTPEEAVEKFNESPQWLKELCVAFADGVNYYLYTHPEVKPKLLHRFEPWMPMYFSEGSIGGDIERVSTEKIKAFYDPETGLASAHDGALNLQYGDLPGSNGIALSGKMTSSGNAMLLINPHTSFFFRGEVHVVSEEGLNAYGAVTWGQFFVYQGFNEKTGWMHTSTGTDIIDEFKETITEDEKGLHYVYGKETRPVEQKQIELKYKTQQGLKEKNYTIYRTHHGPITHAEEGKWIATGLMWDPVNALQQSFLRTKQANHTEFKKMMNRRTNSSNNTVFADAEGNIAYYHGNFIPIRNKKFDYTRAVDGSDPETDWKGLHEVDENIFILNPDNGWIQNCNSTPFTAAGPNSPKKEDYPIYMAHFPENYRGIHAISMLREAENLTLDALIDLAYDPYLPGAEVLITGLLEAAKDVVPKSDISREAIEILKSWDFKVNKESPAMTLAEYYLRSYRSSGKVDFGRRDFIKMVEYMAADSPKEERMSQFEKAVEQLVHDFGSPDVPWGNYNRYQRLNGDIVQKFNDSLESIPVGMAAGYWGALASFGTRYGKDTKRIYGVGGNSFVAVVEFGDRVKAKTLLAGGQSGDPASPHFDDQAQRYADRQFKDAAFYREEVEKRAVSKYSPGQ